MNKINIVGLGSDYLDLSLNALQVIKNSNKIVGTTF